MNNYFEQGWGSPAEIVADEQEKELNHITVCLCTYQRRELLANLLDRLTEQATFNEFKYSIVIVDNDPEKSAREVVWDYKTNSDIPIDYHHEPRKGLTYARNTSLKYSHGDYIAILDDDEVPAWDWLYQLFKTMKTHQADAVFGSVIPNFEVEPPEWTKKRKYFYWRDLRAETGTKTDKCVTNNALVRRDLVVEYGLEFDHDFAFIGGEDQAFFFEFEDHKPDAKFLNCREAIVYEFITADRCDPTYLLKRNILEAKGRVSGIQKFYDTKLKQSIVWAKYFFRSYTRILLISLALPFLFLFKKELGAEYYYRNFFHYGVLLALFDFSPFKDRKSIGLQ